MSSSTPTAQSTWELENAVKLVDPARDQLYSYNADAQKKIAAAKPWRSDPHHFKYVRISAVALVKMVMHAREGGDIEVMGLMLGYVEHETFIVTDAMRLPVEGTETRVNAHTEADEYMVEFLAQSREGGKPENAVGWYHSHPGYGCWLSGIDVSTENTHQTFNDPFLAVVIDPHRTVSAGQVEIGAFRTYPEGYKPAGSGAPGGEDVGMAAVPMAKAADFGAHANRYYPLEVSHFKSTLDSKLLEALWNKYWVQTLSSSPLYTNRSYITSQISDVVAKTNQIQSSLKAKNGGPGGGGPLLGIGPPSSKTKDKEALQKVVRSAEKIANEEKMGLMAAMVKEKVFAAQANGAQHATNGVAAREATVQAQAIDGVGAETAAAGENGDMEMEDARDPAEQS
ncbi:COP9 signalosome complex subunit 5 [Teratosphaeria destructans]|uniref:COP9 signalosome complex subunit 5 n=1 Tax=Teratosphaeria destructans TaxID=418781 RepID=A0A9W7SWL6_9PEZI|nr:COP9 signalosome complex subunit 5 [Teratosphaeria destructans]